MATLPAVSCNHVCGAPTPRGVTRPSPVTTTRRTPPMLVLLRKEGSVVEMMMKHFSFNFSVLDKH